MRGNQVLSIVLALGASVLVGCGDSNGSEGTGITPGLWVGEVGTVTGEEADGWKICLNVNAQGNRLVPSDSCNVVETTDPPKSADLAVAQRGMEPDGTACSFSFSSGAEIEIGSDGIFIGEFSLGAGRTVSLNGRFTDGTNVSGSARAEGGGVPDCELMQWTARPMDTTP